MPLLKQAPGHRELLASRSLQGPRSFHGCMLHNLRPVVGYWKREVAAPVLASLYGWELIVEASKLEKKEGIAAGGCCQANRPQCFWMAKMM